MSLKTRLLKLEEKQPKQVKFKCRPLGVFYGENIPESDWHEYDTIPTFSKFYDDLIL